MAELDLGTAYEPRWVREESEIAALAARVLDPGRRAPLICVTTPPYLRRPMLDPTAVAQAIDAEAEIWVITRAQHAWRLTESLPRRLDVYGGAARLWWPIADAARADPNEHPTFTIFSAEDGERVTHEIAARIRRRLSPPPEPGTDAVGVVTAALDHGAEITLASGQPAFAVNAHLARGPIYKAWEAVREGQQVRVRVSGPPPPGREAVPVSLRPFAPDPWQRLAQVYAVGMDVEGVVTRLRDFGAFVELLPGAEGLLPNPRISRDYVADPGDYLAENDRLVVRLRTLVPDEGRSELSLVDVPDDPDVRPPASLYPDGPPWLRPVQAPVDLAPVDLAPVDLAPVAPGPPPTPDIAAHAAEAIARLPEPVAAAAEPEPEPRAVPEPAELLALAAAVDAGDELAARVATVAEEAERTLVALRGQARRLTSELRDEIAAAELRVLRLAQHETGELLDQAQQEVVALQGRVGELRELLGAAERDREELIRQAHAAAARGAAQAREADTAREAGQRAQARADLLREQLDVVDGGDPARRFLRELHHAWSRLYAGEDDRRRYPFSAPLLGPAFIESLDRIEGVTRDRVLGVCAHVASGRAAELHGLELHQLRTSEAGDAPPRIRDDGATAWRVSLQSNAPSARRLHYWQRRDGQVEFSKVGVHDDLTIV